MPITQEQSNAYLYNGGRLSAPPLSKDEAQRTIDVFNEVLSEGFAMGPTKPGKLGAHAETSNRLGLSYPALRNRLRASKLEYGLEPDLSQFSAPRARFAYDEIPSSGEETAEQIIEHLKAQSAQRISNDNAKQLYQVRVDIDGPIGIALFGDPHVDSPGCDWVALERDVSLCRNAEAVLAVNLGDTSDNWVGRLMGLYAHADVTTERSQKLIEWLLTSLPWLVTIGGNHDLWHTDTADPLEIIHRLREMPGLYQGAGARLQLNLPSGVSAKIHVRHDFPGRSQYNPAHAMVRETLFGYRDDILAHGHRHQSGYTRVWHNDPPITCHAFCIGSYKQIDSFAKEKHFKPENWAPSMMAVIDPSLADDPVNFVTPCFSIEKGVEYLAWRRAIWKSKRAT